MKEVNCDFGGWNWATVRRIFLGGVIGLSGMNGMNMTSGMAEDLNYPVTKKADQVDVLHGVTVADPYRWLEDDRSDETAEWLKAQNKVTFGFLEKIPEREKLKKHLTEMWDYEKFGIPFKRGERYFYFKNDGLQNQSVLYTLTSLDAEPELLLDPNQLSLDGTVALSSVSISPNGLLMAYGISRSGSDWQEWRVRDVEGKRDWTDEILWVKFSGASWTSDSQGFYYSRYDEPKDESALSGANFFQKLYYHRVGTAQKDDVLVYERPDQKEWGFGGTVTDDGRYLVIEVWKGTDPKNAVFYQDLQCPGQPIVELLNTFDASYDFIDNDGSLFWFETNLGAPKSKVIAIDVNQPGRDRWQVVIPEAKETLRGIGRVSGEFVAHYLKDAHSQVKRFDRDGKFISEIPLPGIGTISGFGGKAEDTETFFSFTSYTVPGVIYRYDFQKDEVVEFRKPKVPFDASNYETTQVFYKSKDGTSIPMFLTHKKGLVRDGKTPTYLYGYGGFNIPITPAFSVSRLAWLEMGGIYAVANLRGGGEYGEEWHLAGTKGQKQNVFDDFISAAEWLIREGYTRSDKLAISGRSNGGLLVGACMTQRPELFGAALPGVGVLDMLRFHKFTIGWAWTSDYGSPDNPEDFKALYHYSPLHALRKGTSYPSTLITTADHDDRVVPAHSFKFAAALQEAQAGKAPVLIRIETKAGHGAGKPTAKVIEEVADEYAFLIEVLGMR